MGAYDSLPFVHHNNHHHPLHQHQHLTHDNNDAEAPAGNTASMHSASSIAVQIPLYSSGFGAVNKSSKSDRHDDRHSSEPSSPTSDTANLLLDSKYYSLYSAHSKLSRINYGEVFETAMLVLAWYITSSFSNNLNKSILEYEVFPFPITLTFVQFGFIVVCCLALFQISSQNFKLQKLDRSVIAWRLLPLCVSQIFAHLLTQISLQQVPVSFTHTVKSCSPFFSVLFSQYFRFNERYTFLLIFSIVPMIAGIALSSLTEINFTVLGFLAALGSTIIFSWQNAFSKKVFRNNEMDHVNLLFYTTLCSFVVLFPVWAVMDVPRIIEWSQREGAADIYHVLGLFWLNGMCHFAQNITAFTFMTKVSPLTYTVFNTSKRIFVILSSILYFGNQVSFLNGVGISMAIGGVVLYNKAKYDISVAGASHSKQSLPHQ